MLRLIVLAAAWVVLALAKNTTTRAGARRRRLDKDGCTYIPWKKETECTGPRVEAKVKRQQNVADAKDIELKAEAAERNYQLSIKAGASKVNYFCAVIRDENLLVPPKSPPRLSFLGLSVFSGMARRRAPHTEAGARS